MAGYVAENMKENRVETVQWHEIDQLVDDCGMLIDVRGPNGFATGSIPGSINIPLNDSRDRMNKIPKDKNSYVTYRSGIIAYIATRILKENGYNAKNVDGAWLTYEAVLKDTGSNRVLSSKQ